MDQQHPSISSTCSKVNLTRHEPFLLLSSAHNVRGRVDARPLRDIALPYTGDSTTKLRDMLSTHSTLYAQTLSDIIWVTNVFYFKRVQNATVF